MEMHCNSIDLSCAEHDPQEDLKFVYSWLCINLLSLGVKKSNVMLVGSRRNYKIVIRNLLLMEGHYLVSLHSTTLDSTLMIT